MKNRPNFSKVAIRSINDNEEKGAVAIVSYYFYLVVVDPLLYLKDMSLRKRRYFYGSGKRLPTKDTLELIDTPVPTSVYMLE